jgi:hypothetical protein
VKIPEINSNLFIREPVKLNGAVHILPNITAPLILSEDSDRCRRCSYKTARMRNQN